MMEMVTPRPCVLVVDDNAHMRKLLEIFLKKSYIVITAHNDVTALEQAAEHQFDVVLMDINLGPGLTGVEVLHEMRALKQYERVPIIAVTASASEGDHDRFLMTGFDSYISKPFTKDSLLNNIVVALEVIAAR